MLDYDVQRPQHSPWSQFAILLGLTGIIILLASFVLLPLTSVWLHVSLKDVPAALEKPGNVNANRLLQFVSTFFFFALPAYLLAKIMNRNAFKYTGFNSSANLKQFLMIVLIVGLAFAVSGALGDLNEIIPLSKNTEHYFRNLEDEYNKAMFSIANMKSVEDYIISLLMIALLPALFEEMFFRGTFQPIMISITKNAFAGILITSIVFSAIHGSYYGFLPRLGLGLIIGYVFYFSKNLWLSIATHFLYNAVGVTEMYYLSKAGELNTDAMNDTFPLYYGLIAAAALFVVFIVFKKESEVVISMYNFRHYKKKNEDAGG